MKTGQRVPREKRLKIRRGYLLGEASRSLAKRHCVHPNTITNLAKTYRWHELKDLMKLDQHIKGIAHAMLTALTIKGGRCEDPSSDDDQRVSGADDGVTWSF